MPMWREPGADAEPLEPIVGRLLEVGSEVSPYTCTPQWYGARLDLAWAIDVLRGQPAAADP